MMGIILEIIYHVIEISGDYVKCRSSKGETDIAIYLLPDGIDVGDIIQFKDLTYQIIGRED